MTKFTTFYSVFSTQKPVAKIKSNNKTKDRTVTSSNNTFNNFTWYIQRICIVTYSLSLTDLCTILLNRKTKWREPETSTMETSQAL